jgi:hypothetical protein
VVREAYVVRWCPHEGHRAAGRVLYAGTGPDWVPMGHAALLTWDVREEASDFLRAYVGEPGALVVWARVG